MEKPSVLSPDMLKALNNTMPAEAKYGDVFGVIAETARDDCYERMLKQLDSLIQQAKEETASEIFEEIEKIIGYDKREPRIDYDRLQSLKAKYGGKK